MVSAIHVLNLGNLYILLFYLFMKFYYHYRILAGTTGEYIVTDANWLFLCNQMHGILINKKCLEMFLRPAKIVQSAILFSSKPYVSIFF